MTRELDPQVRTLLEREAAERAPVLSTLSPDGMRAQINDQLIRPDDELEPIDELRDYHIPGPAGSIPIRLFVPEAGNEQPSPLLVYFHGGGWVFGNLDTHQPLCRRLANETGAIVVAVEYRLAPEHPFPAALDDAYAATQWIADHGGDLGGDTDRLAVVGDSAGGNLAATVSLMARNRGGPTVQAQVLAYPVTNYDRDLPSYTENIGVRPSDDTRWYVDYYVETETDARNPYAFPLEARDLSELPPAVIVTAEFDILRDDGARYAERLVEADVPTTHLHYEGMVHRFLSLHDRVETARRGIEDIASELRSIFGR